MKNTIYTLGLMIFMISCDCYPDDNDTSSEGLKGIYSLVETRQDDCAEDVHTWNDLMSSFDDCDLLQSDSNCTLTIDESGRFVIAFAFSNDLFDSFSIDFQGRINKEHNDEDGDLRGSITFDDMGDCESVNISWIDDILNWDISLDGECSTNWQWIQK